MTDQPDSPAGQSVISQDSSEFDALTSIVRALQLLSEDARLRVLNAVIAFLGIAGPRVQGRGLPSSQQSSASGDDNLVPGGFAEDRTLTPKAFLFDKKPRTDVERVAALAYYLTHYRDTPHFKTLDLSKLNTEAAQLKLSNPAKSVNNAIRAGLLVPASKGAKQLSALGEMYVQALPDHAAARSAIAHGRPKRKSRPSSRAVFESGEGPEVE